MFEKYIDALFQRNFSVFENKGDKIKFGDVFAEQKLSPYLHTYFKAEIKWLIFKEKIHIQSSVGASTQSNEEQLSAFNKKLMGKLVIYKEDLKERMYYATKIYFNFTIRPLFTYEKFIFDNNFAKPAEEIERKIEYLHGYDNLREVAADYLECLQQETENPTISADNFLEVVNDADKTFFDEVDTFDLSEYLTPMIECFTDNENKIDFPIDALLLFFDDKNNTAIYEFIEKQKEEKQLTILDEDELQIIINDIAILIGEMNESEEEIKTEDANIELNEDFTNTESVIAQEEIIINDEQEVDDSDDDQFDDLLDDMETETDEIIDDETIAEETESPKEDNVMSDADLIAMAENILQGQ